MFTYAILILLPAVAMTQSSNILANLLYGLLGNGSNAPVGRSQFKSGIMTLDSDSSGDISNSEFNAGLVGINPLFALWANGVYAFLDSNNDGQWTDSEQDVAFNYVDTNNNNQIEKPEFITAVSYLTTLG